MGCYSPVNLNQLFMRLRMKISENGITQKKWWGKLWPSNLRVQVYYSLFSQIHLVLTTGAGKVSDHPQNGLNMVQPFTTINHGDIFPLPLFLMVKSLFFMVKFMFLTGTSFSFNVSISRFSMEKPCSMLKNPIVDAEKITMLDDIKHH